jgi:hypothetical protein
VHHLVRRQLSNSFFYATTSATIKKAEKGILAIHADNSLSDELKHRKSIRRFALIDHSKLLMEMRAREKEVASHYRALEQHEDNTKGNKRPTPPFVEHIGDYLE